LSTKTPFIYVPENIYTKVGFPEVNIDCENFDDLPNVSIKVGSTTIVLKPEDYVFRISKYFLLKEEFAYCWNTFIPSKLPDMIIGTQFFAKFYVKFETN
jgi:hypothetical protein